MAQWSFFTNYGLVLSFLARYPLITGRKLSFEIGITERGVRRIVAELEKKGYVTKEKVGRRVRYKIYPRMSLRRNTQEDKSVGDLLQFLGWQGERGKKGSKCNLKKDYF